MPYALQVARRLRRRGDLPDSRPRHQKGGTMAADDIAYLSALELLERYRGKSLSPVVILWGSLPSQFMIQMSDRPSRSLTKAMRDPSAE